MGKRILVAVIFVPILFVVMMFLPTVVWAAVVALISAMAAHELLKAAGEGQIALPMHIAAVLRGGHPSGGVVRLWLRCHRRVRLCHRSSILRLRHPCL